MLVSLIWINENKPQRIPRWRWDAVTCPGTGETWNWYQLAVKLH